jgi:uncharacterized protein with HEPN domain
MKRTDGAFVDDILIAASRIRDQVRGVVMDDFLRDFDGTTQDAVIRQIGIVGEAASKLSANFRAKYPTIPWIQIIGMRNVVIHQYWEIKLDVVWEAATRDVPALVKKLRAVNDVVEERSRPMSLGSVRSRYRR